jgi:hypothetical protein
VGAEVDRTVPVAIRGDAGDAAQLDVRSRAIAAPDQPPFGVIDLPPDPIVLGSEPITLQGWALDDTDMRRVWVGYVDASGAVVPLGDARRSGGRPDVAAVYPTSHDLFKAAWAFTLEPLAWAGLGRPIKLQVFAEDGSGHRTEIGNRQLK